MIVSWNGIRDLEVCLSSLDHIHIAKDIVLDIVIVDNNSSDNTPQFIQEKYKNVKLLRMLENLGFAGGNNVGFEYIVQENYEYVYLLNQDTVVTPDFLNTSIDIAVNNPDIAQLQSLLLQYQHPTLINSNGNPIHFLGFGYCGDNDKEIDKINKSGFRIIASASCAAVLIKVSALKQIGFFDPLFISYNEDTDLSWRLKLAGFKVVLNPQSIVYHNYEFKKNSDKFYLLEKNREIILLKNYRFRTLLVLFPILITFEVYMLIYAISNGWGWKKILSYKLLIKDLKTILERRRTIQLSRKISDKQILSTFTPILNFSQTPNKIIKLGNPLVKLYFDIVTKGIFW